MRWSRLILLSFGLALGTVRAAAPPDAEFTTATLANLEPDAWSRLTAGGSLEQLGARLRARGWPDFAIRWVVYDQVRERFAARTREVATAIESQYFWRSALATEPKLERLRRELTREITDAARAVMGPTVDALSEGERLVYRRQFGDLPAAKVDAVQRVRDDYRDLIKIARLEAAIVRTPGVVDRGAIALLEREQNADIAKLLTAAEYEGFERRMSGTARLTRARLRSYQPTEEQFLAVYRLQQAYDARFGETPPGLSPEEARRRAEAARELTAKIGEVLRDVKPGPRPPVSRSATDPTWLEQQRVDLAAMQQRLRAAGFPESAVRSVLTIETYARAMRREVREIFEGDGSTYWWDEPGYTLDTPEKEEAKRRIDEDQRTLLTLVRGADPRVSDPIPLAYQRRLFAPMRSGPCAEYLARTVVGFSANGDELEAVTRIYRPLAERFFPDGNLLVGQSEAFAVAERELAPQLRAALGAERFADFEQAKHGDPRLNELVVYLDLPIARARDVVAVQRDIEARAKESGARKAALREEGERRVTELLGARGLDGYRLCGGQWLVSLR